VSAPSAGFDAEQGEKAHVVDQGNALASQAF
jgi:hypothetical protein